MITAIEPAVTLNGQYALGETAKVLGIHRTTLTRYMKRGLIRCNFHRSGRRFFYGREIIRCWKATL